MRYGRSVPNGFLPVYSVSDDKEAEDLITLCCPRQHDGQHYARELANEQTLENLQKFSDKLDEGHRHLKKAGLCRCTVSS